MPTTIEPVENAKKPSEGITISSLLHLAAISRENERSNEPQAPTRAAPLEEVLNRPEQSQLVPLSTLVLRDHDSTKTLSAGPQQVVLDPRTISLAFPFDALDVQPKDGSEDTTLLRLPALNGRRDVSKPAKSAVPLAEVLNHDSHSPHLRSVQPSSRRSSVSSGTTRKRRKLSNIVDSSTAPITAVTSDVQESLSNLHARDRGKQSGQGITLPKLPETSQKASKRKGLPPVISGLHNPPEEARLIPSISTESGIWQPHQAARSSVDHLPSESKAVGTNELRLDDTPAQLDEPIESTQERYSSPDQLRQESNEDESTNIRTPEKGGRKVKPYQRWTQQEHQQLVDGVKKFGIGCWKQILDCPEYTFQPDRTAVDLKDRFRRRFPDQYRAAGKVAIDKRNDKTSKSESATISSDIKPQVALDKAEEEPGALDQAMVHRNTGQAPRNLHEGAFRNGKRRGRVKFTEQEDAALFLGFEKHGAKWHDILTDTKLKPILDCRSRTDLRDRFRNKWPAEFKAAKSAPKPDGPEEKNKADNARPKSYEASNHAGPARSHQKSGGIDSSIINTTLLEPEIAANLDPSIGAPQFGPNQQMTTSLPFLFLDNIDLDGFKNDYDTSSSPGNITLSRQIVDWADQNAPPQTTVGPANQLSPGFSLPTSRSQLTNDPVAMLGVDPLTIHQLSKVNLGPSGSSQSLSSTAMNAMPLAGMLAGDEQNVSNSGMPAVSRALQGSTAPNISLPGLELLLSVESELRPEPFW